MPSLLRQEIGEQPDAVARLLDREAAPVRALARTLRRREIAFVLIAARGTSDNAARYAQYAFGLLNRLPVALATPSLTTVYRRPPRVAGALVIGISQSGRSPDIVETVAAARRAGAPTLAIVNDDASPLAKVAENVLPLHAGREGSVAATKTYTAELAAVALLAASLAGKRKVVDELRRIPEVMSAALGTEPAARRAASLFARTAHAIVLGRGVNLATAFEVALKLKELSLLFAEPYSTADFQHGPRALLSRDRGALRALVISPPGCATEPELTTLAATLVGLGESVITVGAGKGRVLPTPLVPELLSPLVAVVPGQLLAFHVARARGLDPDDPRGIQKVTETL